MGKAFASAILCLLGAAVCTSAVAQSIPKRYQPLYRELDAELTAFDLRVPPTGSGKLPIRAATLLSANCNRGEILLEPGTREATLRELDALKNTGAEGIVLQICYPLLTSAYRDPQPFLDYYINLANEVRSRSMKLLVEHGTLQPAYASVDVRPYYAKLGKARFLRERFLELKNILVALQPDYVTLVSDPGTQSAGIKLTVKDWRGYVARSVDSLGQQLGSFSTLLGAGCGLWDSVEYVDAFARIPKLHYVDLHLFPLVSSGEKDYERMLTWPDRIRETDPSKLVVMSEAWLYKSAAADKFSGTLDPNLAARDAFSFWAPLDQKFLRVVGRAARVKSFELIAPYWSRYFFAYLDYDDPVTYRLNARQLLDLATQRAREAIEANRITDTGTAFRGM